MITRIRYKTHKGIMTSVTPMLAKTTMINITIDLVKMSFIIYDDEGSPLAGGTSTSKQKILNEVKKEVKNLGVLFHDEIRPRKAKVSKNITDKFLEGEVTNVTDSNNQSDKFLE